MTDGLVRLFWRKDPAGYVIAKRECKPGSVAASKYGDGVQDYIVPRGGKTTRYEAGLSEHAIFRDLANSARRPGAVGVLEFVNEWGLLKGAWNKDTHMESFEDFVNWRDKFLDLMSGSNISILEDIGGFATGGLGLLEMRLVAKGRQPRAFLRARSLLQFCVLEFFHAQVGNIDLTACGACGEFLPIHKRGRPKQYCDDKCKMVAHRRRGRTNRAEGPLDIQSQQ